MPSLKWTGSTPNRDHQRRNSCRGSNRSSASVGRLRCRPWALNGHCRFDSARRAKLFRPMHFLSSDCSTSAALKVALTFRSADATKADQRPQRRCPIHPCMSMQAPGDQWGCGKRTHLIDHRSFDLRPREGSDPISVTCFSALRKCCRAANEPPTAYRKRAKDPPS